MKQVLFSHRQSETALQQSMRRCARRNAAFTLLQLIIVVAIISLLAAIFMGAFSKHRETARRTACDMRLKAIALALDAYRQENGGYPATLAALHEAQYLRDVSTLRCPDDPRSAEEASYEDFYVVRASRDSSDSPIALCPFHEESGFGAQAFKGRYTTQHVPKLARITNARNVTIKRPGKQPIAAAPGMTLRGGDRIKVGSGLTTGGILGTGILDSGEAVITFADGSTATLRGGADVTVLQSFLMGSTNAPLYTVLRQHLGRAVYHVNTGSRFDVVTPTSTAGARGTQFTVTILSDGSTELRVTEGKVLFTTLNQTVVAPIGRTVFGLLNGIINIL